MRNVCLVFLFFISSHVKSQVPSWSWASGIGGTGGDEIKDITTDLYGNIYITGSYYSPAISLGGHILFSSNPGQESYYLAKYNSNGGALWVRGSVGQLDAAKGYQVSADDIGNIYVTGSFEGSLKLGNIQINSQYNTPYGRKDMFIAKYDSAGNILWAKSFGGNGRDESYAIVSDPLGNVYFSGYFESDTVVFDNIRIINCCGASINNWNYFIAKLDANGNAIWAKSGTHGQVVSVSQAGYDLAINQQGEVFSRGYIIGSYLSIGGIVLNRSGSILIKYDSNGNVLWGRDTGDNGVLLSNSLYNSISTNGNSGLYFVGVAATGTALGSFPINSGTYIGKYDQNGNISWAINSALVFSGTYQSVFISSVINGSIYVADNAKILVTGGSPAICKYDSLGNLLWCKDYNGTGVSASYFTGIYSGANNEVYTIGEFFSGFLNFDSTYVAGYGSFDAFLAKIDGSTIGIDELDNSLYPSVLYPNPSLDGSVLKSSIRLKNSTLVIQNNIGQSIKRIENFSGNEIALERNDIPPGIYFLKVFEDAKLVIVKKLVFQ